MDPSYEEGIRNSVREAVERFAREFTARHLAEIDNPEGTINSKVNNVFIAALGNEVQFYSALVRSLDSSMGNFIESLALQLAEKHFLVTRDVEGMLYAEQTSAIARLLEEYKSRRRKPEEDDYKELRDMTSGSGHAKVHNSDYVLQHRKTGNFSLIELKFGGDLDNKKARSEKEALLEQYCILSNREGSDVPIALHFATGYNRYGEGEPWRQERVKMFFSEQELLISKDFWNFIIQDQDGFDVLIDEYRKCAPLITESLDLLKEKYVK